MSESARAAPASCALPRSNCVVVNVCVCVSETVTNEPPLRLRRIPVESHAATRVAKLPVLNVAAIPAVRFTPVICLVNWNACADAL